MSLLSLMGRRALIEPSALCSMFSAHLNSFIAPSLIHILHPYDQNFIFLLSSSAYKNTHRTQHTDMHTNGNGNGIPLCSALLCFAVLCCVLLAFENYRNLYIRAHAVWLWLSYSNISVNWRGHIFFPLFFSFCHFCLYTGMSVFYFFFMCFVSSIRFQLCFCFVLSFFACAWLYVELCFFHFALLIQSIWNTELFTYDLFTSIWTNITYSMLSYTTALTVSFFNFFSISFYDFGHLSHWNAEFLFFFFLLLFECECVHSEFGNREIFTSFERHYKL